MKKYLLILAAITCLLCSCLKDEFNVFSPSSIHIGAEGGEVTVKARTPMQWCAFGINYISVYEKDKNGQYINKEFIEYKKSTDALSVGESGDLGYVTATFVNSTTLKFAIAPCDEAIHMNIHIYIENKSKKGKWFAPDEIIIYQNK